jgi:hypothetical protein
MKKAVFLVILLGAFFWCQPLPASQTSILSLGPAACFTIDESDIWQYPAELGHLPRIVVLDMDSFPVDRSRISFLAVFDIGQRYGSLGLGQGELLEQKLLTDIFSSLNYAIANNPLMSPRNSIPLPKNIFHFLYARDIGPVTSGLRISFASALKTRDFSDTIPEDAVKREASSGLFRLDAGASAIIGDKIYIQSGVEYQAISFLTSYKLSGADPAYWEQVDDDGAGIISFRTRLFYGLTDKIKIVPAISLQNLSFGYKASYSDTIHMPGSLNNGTGGEYSVKEMKGTLGAEYCPVDNVKLLGGFSVEFNNIEIDDTNNVWLRPTKPLQKYLRQEKSNLVLPGIMGGIEARLKKWLILRMGANQNIATIKTKTEYRSNGMITETAQGSSSFDICLGLGFEFGGMTIDAQLDENQPFNAGYLISGNNQEPFARLTMTYKY